MADFFIDNMVKKSIIEIIKNKDTIPDNLIIWKSLTRLMFQNYSFAEVFKWVYQSLEEASDEQWFEHKYPKGFFKETWVFPKKKRSVIKINLQKSRLKKLINENLKITEVAERYGIKVKNKKAKCPFHKDKNPSLSLSNEKNVFHCFGCGAKGDIIEFVRRLENDISLEK